MVGRMGGRRRGWRHPLARQELTQNPKEFSCEFFTSDSDNTIHSRESVGWWGFGPDPQTVKMWTERIPCSSLSCLLSPLWESFLVLLTSCPPTATPPDPVKRRGKSEEAQGCSVFIGRGDLERIVLMSFCAKRPYDSFSALSYKLWNTATPSYHLP